MSQNGDRIVEEEQDEPHIEGTRITVRWVYERAHERGLHPETVAGRHNIDIGDVYHALAYYYDNPAEMADLEERREGDTSEQTKTTSTDK